MSLACCTALSTPLNTCLGVKLPPWDICTLHTLPDWLTSTCRLALLQVSSSLLASTSTLVPTLCSVMQIGIPEVSSCNWEVGSSDISISGSSPANQIYSILSRDQGTVEICLPYPEFVLPGILSIKKALKGTKKVFVYRNFVLSVFVLTRVYCSYKTVC